MLEHRWEKRYRPADKTAVKLLLPGELAAIAQLVDISARGMAVIVPPHVRRNSLIKVRYELNDQPCCAAPALVIYRSGPRLGLMLSLTDPKTQELHLRLLDRYRNAQASPAAAPDDDDLHGANTVR